MLMKYLKYFSYILLVFLITISTSFSEIVKSINVTGNERVSKETIIMFSNINIGDNCE